MVPGKTEHLVRVGVVIQSQGDFEGPLKIRAIRLAAERLVVSRKTKDIADILTARKDARTEVFGIFRSVKDGKLTSDFGSDEGHLEQEVAAMIAAMNKKRQP